MEQMYYAPRAEANTVSPEVVEKMLAAAFKPKLTFPPIVSEMLPMATIPDQRGFILGSERL